MSKTKLTIQNLEQTGLNTIIATFNEAFTDYYVKINLTQDQLIQKMTLENIRLKHSAGAFDGDQLVGLILSGIDTKGGLKTAYNGGTGVLPAYRGKGITPQLYSFLIDHYRQEGVQRGLLEVIEANDSAIRSYEKVGFRKLRELDCFKGKIEYDKPEPKLAVLARQIMHPDWEQMNQFWNWEPTWPNTTASIRRAGAGLKLLGLYHDDRLVASRVINTASGRIVQFGVHPDFRGKGLGRLLFYYLGKLGNPNLSIINIDRGDADTIGFLKHIGFSIYISQYEMGLDL